MLSFFPRDILDETWDLTESVSKGFPIYSYFIKIFFVVTISIEIMSAP